MSFKAILALLEGLLFLLCPAFYKLFQTYIPKTPSLTLLFNTTRGYNNGCVVL
jgi:uncharacterized protein YjeT (DUF2065 family)